MSGSALIANNNAMAAFSAYSLRFVGSGITVFQNPSLTTFEAPMLTAIASAAPADVITSGFQVSLLTSAAASSCKLAARQHGTTFHKASHMTSRNIILYVLRLAALSWCSLMILTFTQYGFELNGHTVFCIPYMCIVTCRSARTPSWRS